MKDRFRFRFFDTRNQEMIYDVQQSQFNYHKNAYDLPLLESAMLNEPHIIKLQCTGLKDKDGKLIYEGDIVRINDKYPDYTAIDDFYKNQNFILEFFIPQAKYLMKPREYDDNSGSGIYELSPDFYEFLNWDVKGIEYGLLQGIEVIGNVYENPELLGE